MSYNKHLATIKSRQERIDYLSSAITAHTLAMNGLDPYNQKFLQKTIDDLNAEYKYLNDSKRWNFNFKAGGWNSVIALTKEQAIQIANEKYVNLCRPEGRLTPDPETFRIESEADNKALLSLFY